MPKQIRVPPGPSENRDARALEYFFRDIHDLHRRVGETTVDIGSISAGAVATFTISAPDARPDIGQQVVLGPPSTIDASLVWCGVVSADGVVTVRVYNPTGGAINPVSGVWGVRVLP